MYQHFGELYKHFQYSPELQAKVKSRWDFLSTECTGISYMLCPKFAANGFYIDADAVDIFTHVNKFVEARHPGLGDTAEQEAMRFVSAMTTMTGPRKDTIMKMDAKCYWSVQGRKDYPTLYLCAKPVNEMVCSSAASERVWSIYRFIHTRLRNRLTNERVQKLAFIYINCAILDTEDDTNYMVENEILLNGTDYQDDSDEA